jgi:hypothetical protein
MSYFFELYPIWPIRKNEMKLLLIAFLPVICLATGSFAQPAQKVQFRNDPGNRKVEVHIGGKFFTAFIYPTTMEKQVLYPILTASGKTITRGYPMEPRAFERTDHPHHVGLWFNFGDVNGLDFWNNSFAIKPEEKHKYGSVRFSKILSHNPRRGELVASSDWVDHTGKVLMTEVATYTFSGNEKTRSIKRETKLTAVQQVTFKENKEGLLGLRLDRAFEEPATKPEKFLDANGIETLVPIMNNEGVNGVYRNAAGIKGGEVWGKRSPWVALRANKADEIVTIVILDHPQNPNYPAWSHARGYGLFASNNLGGRVFDPQASEVNIKLQPGQSLIFKHLVVIGGDLSDDQINKLAQSFK